MAVEIKVPRLGWTMEEGTFIEWLKRDGDFVEAGQPLFAIEGDKAIQDVEAIGSGLLCIAPHAPESGAPVRVGATLAYLLRAGEPSPFLAAAPDNPKHSPKRQPEVPQPKPERPAKPGPEMPRPGTAPSKTPPPSVPDPEIPSPKTPGPDLPSPSKPGPEIPKPSEPEISPSEPPQPEPGSPTFGLSHSEQRVRPRISPRALRVSGELAIDWQSLSGTGRGGRIRERDVRAAAENSRDKDGQSRGAVFGAGTTIAGQAALRRTIAARMTAGSQQTAPVTLTTTVDASNLVNLRAQFKAAANPGEAAPGYLAFIVKLAARALAEHPALNQQWLDSGIKLPDGFHIAVAVDTPAGLLAPVVRDVSTLGVRDIAARLADLTTRAHSAQLTSTELNGGTFTISNLGAFGIDAFTPILNVPQCAILGLGRIERRPAVVGDQIVPRDQMVLSLTFDHRIVDGAPAAKFLAALRKAIEDPAAWLIS